MSKLIFKKEKDVDNRFDITEITMSVEGVTMEEIVEEFGRFLIACGYSSETVRDYLNNENV